MYVIASLLFSFLNQKSRLTLLLSCCAFFFSPEMCYNGFASIINCKPNNNCANFPNCFVIFLVWKLHFRKTDAGVLVKNEWSQRNQRRLTFYFARIWECRA